MHADGSLGESNCIVGSVVDEEDGAIWFWGGIPRWVARVLMALLLSLERRESSIDRSQRVVEIASGRIESWRQKTATILPLSVTQKVFIALEMILLTKGSSRIFSQCG